VKTEEEDLHQEGGAGAEDAAAAVEEVGPHPRQGGRGPGGAAARRGPPHPRLQDGGRAPAENEWRWFDSREKLAHV